MLEPMKFIANFGENDGPKMHWESNLINSTKNQIIDFDVTN